MDETYVINDDGDCTDKHSSSHEYDDDNDYTNDTGDTNNVKYNYYCWSWS